ncbi:MAG: glycosyltransferase family 39 protein, partial [Acidobacteriales bacterium]|nr:glycosyltransferase family 39 protein [Terriglobales bacterium]
MSRRVAQYMLFVVCLLYAGGVRYYRLGAVPNGLFFDEAAEGNDAARVLASGEYRIFYPSDAGREGLWTGLIAQSERVFGKTPLAVRFWSALAGLLTVVFTWLLAREWFGGRAAIFSAWFLATSLWHVVFSRIEFRGILVPLFIVAAIYALQRAVRSQGGRQMMWAGMAGIVYGVGFYSYAPYRISPLLMLLCFWLWRRRPGIVRALAVFAVCAGIAAAPLGVYFVRHPHDFYGRMSEVSVFAGGHAWRALLLNVVRTAGMFLVKGDGNWRHNIRHAPELLAPVALVFLIGIGVSWRRARRFREGSKPAVVVLWWLGLLLLPEILSGDAVPHSLRAIGAIPAVFMLAGVGADSVFAACRTRWLRWAVIAVVVLSGLVETYRYFFVWGRSAEVERAYFELTVAASKQVARLSERVLVAVEEPPGEWKGTGFVRDG